MADNLQGTARQREPLSAAQDQSLLSALPMPWQGFVLQQEEPIPDWAAWTEHPGTFLRRLDPMAPGMGVMLQVYRLEGVGRAATGRLVATGDAMAPTDVRRDSLIPVIADVWEGGRAGHGADPALPIFLFAGSHPWPFDARPWMVGTTPVLRLSASVAAQRWRDVRLWEARSAHSAHLPLRPVIWEDDWGQDAAPVQGLRACEQRHLRVVGGQPAAHPAPPRRRPRGEGDGADPDWLDLQRPPSHASPSGNALPHGPRPNQSGRGPLVRMLTLSRTSLRQQGAWLVRLGAMSGVRLPIAACLTASGNAPFASSTDASSQGPSKGICT